MIVFYVINAFVHFDFLGDAATPAGIAVVHSIFNIAATIVLLPFAKVLEKLAYMSIKEDHAERRTAVQETEEELKNTWMSASWNSRVWLSATVWKLQPVWHT